MLFRSGLAFLPIYLWVITGNELFASPILVSGWLVAISFLLISNVPTLSWSRLRPRKTIRLEVIALAGLVVAALLTEPWLTLVGICVVYLLLIPVGIVAYGRVKRRRAKTGAAAPEGSTAPPPAA